MHESLHNLYSGILYLLDLLSEGLCDLRVGMAHNGRAPAAYIVDVLHKPPHMNWASVQANLAWHGHGRADFAMDLCRCSRHNNFAMHAGRLDDEILWHVEDDVSCAGRGIDE